MSVIFNLLAGTLLLHNTQAGDTFNYTGCFKEKNTFSILQLRALPFEKDIPDSGLTIEMCRDLCSGYPYMGVQSEDECYCGYAGYDRYGVSSNCDQNCSGNLSQICGGDRLNSVYRIAEYNYRYKGCYKDKEDSVLSSRALEIKKYGYERLTVDICMTLCSGYKYFGVQSGNDCYCGNSGYGKHGLSAGCNKSCLGDLGQMCGGELKNSVYEIVVITATKSTLAHSTTSTATNSIGGNNTATDSTSSKRWTAISSRQNVSMDLATKATGHTEIHSTSEGMTNKNDYGNSEKKQTQTSAGVYAGSAVAAIIVCAAIIILIVVVLRRRKRFQPKREIQLEMDPNNETENVSGETPLNQPNTINEIEYCYVTLRSADQPHMSTAQENGRLTDDRDVSGSHLSDQVTCESEDCDAQNEYSLAGAIEDTLVVEENELYGT